MLRGYFQCRVDGLIISNTTTSRPDSLRSNLRREVGGLSGKPLKELSTKAIKEFYSQTKGKIKIKKNIHVNQYVGDAH